MKWPQTFDFSMRFDLNFNFDFNFNYYFKCILSPNPIICSHLLYECKNSIKRISKQ